MRPTGLKSYDKKRRKAVFECSVPGTRGHKRIRKVVVVKDAADLNEKLHNFRAKIKGGETTIVADVPTLRVYLKEQWESYAIRLSHNKRRSCEAILNHHLLPLLGNTRIDRITSAHVDDVVAAMRKKTHDEKHYSNAYINTCLHLLRSILMHAYRRRFLQEPPFARDPIHFLPEQPVQNELTTAERDAFLGAFDDEAGFRNHFAKIIAHSTKKKIFRKNSEYATYYFERFHHSKSVYVTACFTGLRFTDLRLLKWSSVDLQAGTIRLIMRKTKRPVLIPIVPRLREALQECRRRSVVSEYVLITPDGKPYSKATMMRYFKIAKAIAGIKRPFRFHDQRHTYASILASKGINAFTLRDLLGHTSTRTTERYARPSSETFAAVERALA